MHSIKLKGQTAIEYLLVVSIIVALMVVILLNGGNYVQETISLSAARNFLLNYTARNPSLAFTTLAFNLSGSNFTIYPHIYLNGIIVNSSNDASDVMNVGYGMLNAINLAITSQELNPSAVISLNKKGDCSTIGHYYYCVMFQ
ncbi:MAG: hypothetical protein M1594_00840 [Candidatus Marsarchaeota archaeon]|nr:hypothetical protein [Candidatus Marsarchaeota archaeon]